MAGEIAAGKTTPLTGLNASLGGRMVAFAGYEMPVQFHAGVMKEHLHTREAAGLFDVSHMGQVILRPHSGRVDDAALALERIVPVDVVGLKPGRQRYGLFTDDAGGLLDDLMIANRGDHLFLVVNAACKDQDIAHLSRNLSEDCEIDVLDRRALVALQGPQAEQALARLLPGVEHLSFMQVGDFAHAGHDLIVARSGYTGEDGFEISVPAAHAEDFARGLLADPMVQPIGLGARDSLRLEAGLCLYGNDIDRSTNPVEAALEWAIQKSRRTGGAREGGFPGAGIILQQLGDGASRRRVGLRPEGRAPMRAGTALFAEEAGCDAVGSVTSGGFGPSFGGPVAMGYVPTALASPGTRLWADLRGQRLPVTIASLPFVTQRYKRN